MNYLMLLTQPLSEGEGLYPAPSGSRIYILPKEEAKKRENTNTLRAHFQRKYLNGFIKFLFKTSYDNLKMFFSQRATLFPTPTPNQWTSRVQQSQEQLCQEEETEDGTLARAFKMMEP